MLIVIIRKNEIIFLQSIDVWGAKFMILMDPYGLNGPSESCVGCRGWRAGPSDVKPAIPDMPTWHFPCKTGLVTEENSVCHLDSSPKALKIKKK